MNIITHTHTIIIIIVKHMKSESMKLNGIHFTKHLLCCKMKVYQTSDTEKTAKVKGTQNVLIVYRCPPSSATATLLCSFLTLVSELYSRGVGGWSVAGLQDKKWKCPEM